MSVFEYKHVFYVLRIKASTSLIDLDPSILVFPPSVRTPCLKSLCDSVINYFSVVFH